MVMERMTNTVIHPTKSQFIYSILRKNKSGKANIILILFMVILVAKQPMKNLITVFYERKYLNKFNCLILVVCSHTRDFITDSVHIRENIFHTYI